MQIKDMVYGALGSILAALMIWIGSSMVDIRDSVKSLQQYHASEWPLERQLLAIEISQLKAKIEVNESTIDKLEDQIRNLR